MYETRSAQCSALSPACDWLSATAPTRATAAPCHQTIVRQYNCDGVANKLFVLSHNGEQFKNPFP